ncbi:MAG: hypothetical protein NZM28_07250 [Fimbriimonadales bacterium]|nr:hypothetical protein [Fimbriimonadales bacterium]
MSQAVAPSSAVPARFAEWRQWIETLVNEVGRLQQVRYIYHTVQEMTASNSDLQGLPNLFRGWWMPYTYFHTMFTGARRLADTHRDSRSLHRLLLDVQQNAQLIDTQYYIALYDRPNAAPDLREWWIETLAHRFRHEWGRGGDVLDSEVMQRDLDALQASYAHLKEFVDRHLAHLDPQWAGAIPSDEALEQFLNLAEDMLNRYHSLIVGGAYLSMRPQIAFAWKTEFSVRWGHPLPRESMIDKQEQARRIETAARMRLNTESLKQLEQLIEKHEAGKPLSEEDLATIDDLERLTAWFDEVKASLLLIPKPLTDEKKAQNLGNASEPDSLEV